MNKLKRAIRDMAFKPFLEGQPLQGHHPEDLRDHSYLVISPPTSRELELQIRVRDEYGISRYFTIKIIENV